MPELPESSRPAPIQHALARFFTHPLPHFLIASQESNRARDVFYVVGFGDQSIDPVLHQFLGAAQVGNNHRKPRGLRFDNDITEGVGRAGENEDVGGGVSFRERLAREMPQENRLGRCGGERF